MLRLAEVDVPRDSGVRRDAGERGAHVDDPALGREPVRAPSPEGRARRLRVVGLGPGQGRVREILAPGRAAPRRVVPGPERGERGGEAEDVDVVGPEVARELARGREAVGLGPGPDRAGPDRGPALPRMDEDVVLGPVGQHVAAWVRADRARGQLGDLDRRQRRLEGQPRRPRPRGDPADRDGVADRDPHRGIPPGASMARPSTSSSGIGASPQASAGLATASLYPFSQLSGGCVCRSGNSSGSVCLCAV